MPMRLLFIFNRSLFTLILLEMIKELITRPRSAAIGEVGRHGGRYETLLKLTNLTVDNLNKVITRKRKVCSAKTLGTKENSIRDRQTPLS